MAVMMGYLAALTAGTIALPFKYGLVQQLDDVWQWVGGIAIFIAYLMVVGKLIDVTGRTKLRIRIVRTVMGAPILAINLSLYSLLLAHIAIHYQWLTRSEVEAFLKQINAVFMKMIS